MKNQEQKPSKKHYGKAYHMALSHNDDWVYLSASTVTVLCREDERIIEKLTSVKNAQRICISPNGRYIAFTFEGIDGVKVYSIETPHRLLIHFRTQVYCCPQIVFGSLSDTLFIGVRECIYALDIHSGKSRIITKTSNGSICKSLYCFQDQLLSSFYISREQGDEQHLISIQDVNNPKTIRIDFNRDVYGMFLEQFIISWALLLSNQEVLIGFKSSNLVAIKAHIDCSNKLSEPVYSKQWENVRFSFFSNYTSHFGLTCYNNIGDFRHDILRLMDSDTLEEIFTYKSYDDIMGIPCVSESGNYVMIPQEKESHIIKIFETSKK